jgi:hypothetical protein
MTEPYAETTAAPAAAAPARRRWRSPGWLFHSLLVVACLPILWSASYAGLPLFPWLLPGLFVLLGFGVVWLIRACVCLVDGGGPLWRLAIAPVIVLLVAAAVVANLPLRARFELSRSAFVEVVATAASTCDQGRSIRVGTYDDLSCQSYRGGVRFDDPHGSDLLTVAGFAYLPRGVPEDWQAPDLESPSFVSLGGGWYSWTAGW